MAKGKIVFRSQLQLHVPRPAAACLSVQLICSKRRIQITARARTNEEVTVKAIAVFFSLFFYFFFFS